MKFGSTKFIMSAMLGLVLLSTIGSDPAYAMRPRSATDPVVRFGRMALGDGTVVPMMVPRDQAPRIRGMFNRRNFVANFADTALRVVCYAAAGAFQFYGRPIIHDAIYNGVPTAFENLTGRELPKKGWGYFLITEPVTDKLSRWTANGLTNLNKHWELVSNPLAFLVLGATNYHTAKTIGGAASTAAQGTAQIVYWTYRGVTLALTVVNFGYNDIYPIENYAN